MLQSGVNGFAQGLLDGVFAESIAFNINLKMFYFANLDSIKCSHTSIATVIKGSKTQGTNLNCIKVFVFVLRGWSSII